MLHKIQDDAIFIADAHYQVGLREDFYHFLEKIESGDIQTSQLIMIGDMFDLLVGAIDYTVKENQKVIDIIHKLSEKMEILYFEGNHDFNLQKLFPKVKVIKISQQPLLTTYHDKKLSLAHGDLHQGLGYKFYTYLIRNFFILKLLNFLDVNFNNFISKSILNGQKNKDICRKIENFAQIIKQKSKKYDIASNGFDVICEGHYHINEEYSLEGCQYRLFASYACGNIYFKIAFTDKVLFTKHTM
ncbi:MAG TPA: hypothetical protein EYG95_02135 [Campylobacterales bacterium]|nr:hypothetical protein [Campylobacterales bacterium]